MEDFRPGKYQYYKGGYYQVISLVTHTETLEELVLYRHDSGDSQLDATLWVRPKSMFTEMVMLDGKSVSRFIFIG